jgi:hypothetical protein
VGIDQLSPEFLRAEVMAESPMVWMLQVDGLLIDARLPVEIQVEAFQRGLIPYIPAVGPEGTAARTGQE